MRFHHGEQCQRDRKQHEPCRGVDGLGRQHVPEHRQVHRDDVNEQCGGRAG